jgi:hypothetical protein
MAGTQSKAMKGSSFKHSVSREENEEFSSS